MIKFKEERQIIGGAIVKAGETRTFSPEEEAAFIANGVAEAVVEKKAEVKSNG